jgi:hypothetical protein
VRLTHAIKRPAATNCNDDCAKDQPVIQQVLRKEEGALGSAVSNSLTMERDGGNKLLLKRARRSRRAILLAHTGDQR